MNKPSVFKYSPGQVMLFSFLVVITFGTILLSLPISKTIPISFIDTLFSATSATCITGLPVVPIDSFTTFGKIIILALMQIGGLGLVTLSFFLVSLFLDLGIATRLLAGEILEFQAWGKIKQFLTIIISVTLFFEAIGTIILYFQYQGITHHHGPLFLALFHSVAAFCSGGISLLSPTEFQTHLNIPTILTLSMLMFAGSIGFIVWYDFIKIAKAMLAALTKRRRWIFRTSLHTQIVLVSSLLLICIGGFLIWAIEQNYTLRESSTIYEFLLSLFTAMNARGIGFPSINIEAASQATLLIVLILMFIGASPGSTGSGIKTTTFAVFIASVFSIINDRASVEIAHRRIPNNQVFKSIAIVSLGTFIIFLTTFLLLLFEPQFRFIEILFECVSALGNCGLSLGITPHLGTIGKTIIIATMLIGRIGSLTIVIALQLRKPEKQILYQFPEERIMIG